ncbi:hypothetical protein IMZ31_19260 (plasmid) [Pontibacillus sp. ALD_SL1]|uniref:topoisomerase C-terminal repeat-containing protein n=1 Tax=Pontibacillus sp. ALD_SL1 TaxID=2777185 RepID=UPI001A96D720|nr:topoisomerase C-terminal repeat-containing protein [Pontibacillus sp. ALD_SL1]QST02689.1 hypothetical protein IMZ31_19260 [Pontibacillus sp. ALD_SL1]
MKCPRCGSFVREEAGYYICKNCFIMKKEVYGTTLTERERRELILYGETPLITRFIGRNGERFHGYLCKVGEHIVLRFPSMKR